MYLLITMNLCCNTFVCLHDFGINVKINATLLLLYQRVSSDT